MGCFVRTFRLRRWLALALLAFGSSLAQGIPYAVQVAALSSEARARLLQTQLTEQGFPSYLTAVPSAQGPVYRVRIGGFANRAAAARFAERLALPGSAGATPALAENIPPGLIALEPELLGSFAPGVDRVRVLEWPGGPALRTQGASETEARYRLPGGTRLEGFWAAPDALGVRVLRALPLWPEDSSALGESERARYRAAVLENVAASLEVSPSDLERFVFAPDAGAPYLAVLERLGPGGPERLAALGDPAANAGAEGPALVSFGAATPAATEWPELRELWRLEATPAAAASVSGEVAGAEWQAHSDGGFVRLEHAGLNWRALPGAPLWGGGDLLAVLDGGAVVLYALRAP